MSDFIVQFLTNGEAESIDAESGTSAFGEALFPGVRF